MQAKENTRTIKLKLVDGQFNFNDVNFNFEDMSLFLGMMGYDVRPKELSRKGFKTWDSVMNILAKTDECEVDWTLEYYQLMSENDREYWTAFVADERNKIDTYNRNRSN